MTLWNLAENKSAEIDSFGEMMDLKYQLRLRDLGFDASAPISCLKAAPFGGPRVYQIGDSVFSLTKDLANNVIIHTK